MHVKVFIGVYWSSNEILSEAFDGKIVWILC